MSQNVTLRYAMVFCIALGCIVLLCASRLNRKMFSYRKGSGGTPRCILNDAQGNQYRGCTPESEGTVHRCYERCRGPRFVDSPATAGARGYVTIDGCLRSLRYALVLVQAQKLHTDTKWGAPLHRTPMAALAFR